MTTVEPIPGIGVPTAGAEKPEEFTGEGAMLAYLGSDKLVGKDTVSVVLHDGAESRAVEFTRHVNPDGSRGGFVGSGADGVSPKIDKGTYIDPTAVVYGAFTITKSRIEAGASITSMGKRGASAGGDRNVIEDSTIGAGTRLTASGTSSRFVIRHARIGDDVDIDLGMGSAYIHNATIGDNVRANGGAKSASSMLYLGIEESSIGNGTGIDLDHEPPRLDIVDQSVPANALVTIDSRHYYHTVGQNSRMPNDVYTVEVPDLNDKALSKFADDARAYADSHALAPTLASRLQAFAGDQATAKKLERVALMANHVWKYLGYDADTYKGYPDAQAIPLDYFITNRGGVCFEHALLLYEVLAKELAEGRSDVKPRFVDGAAEGNDSDSLHAWVEVEIDGKVFVIDPTTPMFNTIAGKREDDGTFVRFSGVYGRDYVPNGRPAVKT